LRWTLKGHAGQVLSVAWSLDGRVLASGADDNTIRLEPCDWAATAAVFVGKTSIGPWQNMELEAFLRQFVKRRCPVIPVILPSSKKTPKPPVFLEGMTWVDFRKRVPDPMERLIWGITGERRLAR
jgi:hypothetical protein